MRPVASWAAFLVMLFAIVGMCGLFASYATSIPLERGTARSALLDQVLRDADAPEKLETLRRPLGDLAAPVLDGRGPLADRIAAARAVVLDEQQRETSSVAFRTRLMLSVVTVLAAGLGVGIVSIAGRGAARNESG